MSKPVRNLMNDCMLPDRGMYLLIFRPVLYLIFLAENRIQRGEARRNYNKTCRDESQQYMVNSRINKPVINDPGSNRVKTGIDVYFVKPSLPGETQIKLIYFQRKPGEREGSSYKKYLTSVEILSQLFDMQGRSINISITSVRSCRIKMYLDLQLSGYNPLFYYQNLAGKEYFLTELESNMAFWLIVYVHIILILSYLNSSDSKIYHAGANNPTKIHLFKNDEISGIRGKRVSTNFIPAHDPIIAK